jgi:glutathione S-transferase
MKRLQSHTGTPGMNVHRDSSEGAALIVFYYGSGSPFAWRVWLALEHKRLAYDLKEMSFSAGDLKTEAYRRINPRCKVPAIDDNGFTLYESAAIVEYLDDQYAGEGAPLFPGDARNRAHIRRLINETDLYFDAASRRLLQSVLFTKKEDWDESRIKRAREAVAVEMTALEERLSADYFAGQISAADFTIYPMIALLLRMDLRKPDLEVASLVGPKLTAWTKRLESLPLFSMTYPPHWKKQ